MHSKWTKKNKRIANPHEIKDGVYSCSQTYRCDSRGRRSRPSHEKLTTPLVQSSLRTLGLYWNTQRRKKKKIKLFLKILGSLWVSLHPEPVWTGLKTTAVKERAASDSVTQILQKAASAAASLTLAWVNSPRCPQDMHVLPIDKTNNSFHVHSGFRTL